jgi:hypothetical protein
MIRQAVAHVLGHVDSFIVMLSACREDGLWTTGLSRARVVGVLLNAALSTRQTSRRPVTLG